MTNPKTLFDDNDVFIQICGDARVETKGYPLCEARYSIREGIDDYTYFWNETFGKVLGG